MAGPKSPEENLVKERKKRLRLQPQDGVTPPDIDIAAPFAIGEAWVDPTTNSIEIGDRVARLEPRLMYVLTALVQRAGETVAREDLLAAAWGESAVSDESLTETISRLRRLFGDRAASPRVIQTVSKKGYRLIAPVRALRASRPHFRSAVAPLRAALQGAGAAAVFAIAAIAASSLVEIGANQGGAATEWIASDPDPNPDWLDVNPNPAG